MTTIRNHGYRWRRTCFAVATVSALVLIQACGADSDSAGTAGTAGAGAMAGMGGSGGTGGASVDGGTDSGGSGGVTPDASDGAAGQSSQSFRARPVSYLVHASPELFAFRACVEGANGFLTTYPYPSDADHHLPETNYPGVAVGGVVRFDEVADLIASQASYTVRLVRADHPSVVRARPSASTPVTCADLFDAGSLDLLPAQDHADFPAREPDDLFSFDFRALVVDGCRASASLTDALCGVGYDPAQGNLRTSIMGFSPDVQFEPTSGYVFPVHRSPALTALQQADQTLELSREDGAAPTLITTDLGTDLPAAGGGELAPPANIADYGTHGFTLTAKQTAGTDETLLKASLSVIQRVSEPYEAPDAFFTGSNGFVLLFIGDTSASTEDWLQQDGTWNAAYDGRGLHALALRFQFEYR